MTLTIAKFGGSSLSTESQFLKVKNIVSQDETKKIVVVSAIGRKNPSDDKVTDLLYLIAAHVKHGVSYQALWDNLVTRFVAVKEELQLKYDILSHLEELKCELDSGQFTEDYLVSRGEYFTAHLMAEYLGYQFIDAAEVISFSGNGRINLEMSKRLLQEQFSGIERIVLPGFYGAFQNGKIKLLSRGGSDISGAILASCLGADKYENWTDVSGVMMADPRIINNPATISELTYEELSELSYMGASVLHAETIYPIRELNIPLHIKNTNAPDAEGTLILAEHRTHTTQVSGISGRKNYVSINIVKNQMATEVGFLQRTLKIFDDYHLNIEHLPTGINQIGVIVEMVEVEEILLDLLDRLKKDLKADDVTVKENISLLTVVGEEIIRSAKVTNKIFTALAKEDIDIELITQSPRGINIIIGVANKHYQRALVALYEELTT
ncbi:aspartate kinase [Lactococcus garvieae subsp. garvieae]|uniref:aspartate kinase n=1 Tax=Lactococcus garvieae TaxID=1363 RepID=UPI0005AA4645|nr:aspartate kinase [Lactococcus garvieae]KAA8711899.1 aspartate kinase [Lactococcus garvieae subsp. garvieae]MCI3861063.1 aspartate kinase [Lactococcus garvieae]MDG6191861.1 aspartate kinase [Lactococcus garvieae]QPR49692.1 aspartate kinase [Lactococcus garvieae]